MTHLCEICEVEEIEVLNESTIGLFNVCVACSAKLNEVLNSTHIEFEDIPEKEQKEFTPGCHGWEKGNHLTDEKLIFVLDSEDDEIIERNIMVFCRSCFIDYVNDD